MLVQPHQPHTDEGRVAATYSFLIESFAEYPQSLSLGRARASIAGRRSEIVCRVGGRALAELLLQAHGRYRVDCDFGFKLSEIPLDAIGDATAHIAIPMMLDGESNEATFSYYFRREDAS